MCRAGLKHCAASTLLSSASLSSVSVIRGASVVVVCVCHKGRKLSQGVAAWLLRHGSRVKVLEGGAVGWVDANMSHVPAAQIPAPDENGETAWVSRLRSQIDRKACLWLSRRFVEPHAVFLFVVPSQVEAVAEHFDANPFGEERVPLSDSPDRCRFYTILEHFELESIAALQQLATIIRGAVSAARTQTNWTWHRKRPDC
jgi:hypothetical protein